MCNYYVYAVSNMNMIVGYSTQNQQVYNLLKTDYKLQIMGTLQCFVGNMDFVADSQRFKMTRFIF